MELLIDAIKDGSLSTDLLFVVMITGMGYALRVARKDNEKEREEKTRILDESQKNLSWYQRALDNYQTTINRMVDKNGN